MKIIDSSFLIAVISDINCEQLIENLLKLNHELIVPYSVCHEVIFGKGEKSFQSMIEKDYFQVVQLNTIEELGDLQTTYPYLGFGELDTILTYEKLQAKAYCVLDDKLARKIAKLRLLPFTGTLGLLKLMKERFVISNDEYLNALKDLVRSGFRMPKEFVK